MIQPDTSILANVEGLVPKVWLADSDKNSYEEGYLRESKNVMQNFMKSDLVKAVVSRPFVSNANSVDYQINKKSFQSN